LKNKILTAVDRLRSLLLLLASVVLSGLLNGETSFGASGVEVAVVVHGLLERVAFPTEDVITVCSRTARSPGLAFVCFAVAICSREVKKSSYVPNVHAVNERIRTISGPQALVGKLFDIPHEFVHDLRKLDGVSRWASAASSST
jgi:hypothetical protein